MKEETPMGNYRFIVIVNREEYLLRYQCIELPAAEKFANSTAQHNKANEVLLHLEDPGTALVVPAGKLDSIQIVRNEQIRRKD
jgi:redox-sensitive bicupin YhaK (pirin superfamily)